MDGILNVMGKWAGLAGLALGLFLLIARYVVKKVPAPNKTPVKPYFKVIDRIILFAFVLSLIGLFIYAYTETIESKTLTSENTNLKEKLEQITDPLLKSKTQAFEVLSAEITFDLTKWEAVPNNLIGTEKRGFELTQTKRKVWRASKESEKFIATYSTKSKFDPHFQAGPDYPLNPIPNTDKIQPGKEAQPRWVLEYDVSNAPLFEPFEIVTTTQSWNTLQNTSEEKEGTLILFPTRKATLKIIFPPNKLAKKDSIKCLTMPFLWGLSESTLSIPQKFESPQLKYEESKTGGLNTVSSVTWEISEPRLYYHYLIKWEW